MNTQTHKTSASTGISRHWLDVLEENHVHYMALDPQHDAKLIEQLHTRSDWMVDFANHDAVFFVRNEIAVSN